MTRNQSISVVTAMVVFGMAGSAPAQQITDARIRELIKEATSQTGRPPIAADVRQPATGESRPVVQLTLDDAVKFALDRNLDISVQRLNPQINDIAIASIRSVYHPSLTSTVSQASTRGTPTSQLQLSTGGGGTNTETLAYNGGLAQSLPWGGGSYQFTLNNSRGLTNSNNALFNPQFNSIWTGVFVQPLLRNFRIDSNRQQLQVSKLNRDISDVQLRSTIT
ncbi:MAG: hypothetical protein DMF98_01680, partial [Acidobacteria bacterium]